MQRWLHLRIRTPRTTEQKLILSAMQMLYQTSGAMNERGGASADLGHIHIAVGVRVVILEMALWCSLAEDLGCDILTRLHIVLLDSRLLDGYYWFAKTRLDRHVLRQPRLLLRTTTKTNTTTYYLLRLLL